MIVQGSVRPRVDKEYSSTLGPAKHVSLLLLLTSVYVSLKLPSKWRDAQEHISIEHNEDLIRVEEGGE